MSALFAISVAMGIANPEPEKLLGLIAGPTASGKTALALRIAETRDVTIINADSAQVYRDLPILSAQPREAEQAACPHRLFGYLDGRESCSAARWAADAKREIEAAWDAGRYPLLVGGTGLYLRTLLDGIAPIPAIDPDIRADVRAMDIDLLRPALAREDPGIARELHPNDRSRLQRALETIRSTGRSIAHWRAKKVGGIGDAVDLTALVLLPPREWLYDRCDRRFASMIEQGAVDEVRALLARDLPEDCPVMRAIGVPELRAYLSGEIDQDEASARASQATRNYAKRQYTWFRGQAPETWQQERRSIDVDNISAIVTLFQK